MKILGDDHALRPRRVAPQPQVLFLLHAGDVEHQLLDERADTCPTPTQSDAQLVDRSDVKAAAVPRPNFHRASTGSS